MMIDKGNSDSAVSSDYSVFDGASILVTGGTGSFGKAFVSQVLKHSRPRRLVVLSRDEFKQFEMSMVLSEQEHPCLRYYLGDVRDVERLEMAMRGVDFVIHAAALKQVPAAENNPFECIHTNVLGAENIVRAALRCQVKKVVALSTDKAVNPINLYGASKLASDKIFIAANVLSGDIKTRFSVVRYGNVAGSRGSVVQVFRRLIAKQVKELPITDVRMTRFWITMEHGIKFVASSLNEMRGGEIFIPKIPSARMTDLAKAMAPDLGIQIIGIRPGEKLHEVLITEDDARQTIEHGSRYIIVSSQYPDLHKWYCSQGGKPIGESFRYDSEKNEEWLSVGDLQRQLETIYD